MPLLLRLPTGRHAGTRVASVVSLVDLGPTLIELAGADDERSTQGVSFAGRIADEPPSAAAGFAFSELHPDPPIEQALRARRHRTAIASRAWSYIGVGDRGAELYDRAADPRQQHDRAGEQPLVSAAFANELATFAEANRKHGAGEAPQVPLGERDRQQLRALGYLE